MLYVNRSVNSLRRMFSLNSLAGVTLVLLGGAGSGVATAQEHAAFTGGGPSEDRTAVAAVLREYLRVTDEQSQASIARSFHPTALLMSATQGGELYALTQAAWWQRVSRPRSAPIRRQSTIRHIDVVGAAAIARIDIVTGDSRSTDYLTLLRLADGWRIVNKALSSAIE
jgi:hypothetical protein